MPSNGKFVVFVSSAADADVLEERSAAKLAIQRQDMEFSGMELWPANATTTIEEESLEYVHAADLIVGIFGGRCGVMTRRELDAATSKPRLLFFRRKEGQPRKNDTIVNSIPPEERNDDEKRLVELHTKVTKLQGAKIVYFSNPDELRAEIGDALRAHGKKVQGGTLLSMSTQLRPDLPPYLETLCNRNDQQSQIDALLDASIAGKNKVLIVGLRGPRLEDHHAFVDWYHYLRLHADYASASGRRKAISGHNESRRGDIVSVEWPHGSSAGLDGRFNDLRKKLARKLLNSPELPGDTAQLDNAIQQALGSERQHLTIRHTIISGQCSSDEVNLLARWLDYWRKITLPFDGTRTTIFFCMREDHRGIGGLLFARRYMNACLEALEARKSATFICPPALKSPKRIDIDVWAEERCPDYFSEIDVGVLKREAARPFEGQECVPFEIMKVKLREALVTAHEQYRR